MPVTSWDNKANNVIGTANAVTTTIKSCFGVFMNES